MHRSVSETLRSAGALAQVTAVRRARGSLTWVVACTTMAPVTGRAQRWLAGALGASATAVAVTLVVDGLLGSGWSIVHWAIATAAALVALGSGAAVVTMTDDGDVDPSDTPDEAVYLNAPLRAIDLELFGLPATAEVERETVAVGPLENAPAPSSDLVSARADEILTSLRLDLDRLDAVCAIIDGGSTPPIDMASWPVAHQLAAAQRAATMLAPLLAEASQIVADLVARVTPLSAALRVPTDSHPGGEIRDGSRPLVEFERRARLALATLTDLRYRFDALAGSFPWLVPGAETVRELRQGVDHLVAVAEQWVGRSQPATVLDLTAPESAGVHGAMPLSQR